MNDPAIGVEDKQRPLTALSGLLVEEDSVLAGKKDRNGR